VREMTAMSVARVYPSKWISKWLNLEEMADLPKLLNTKVYPK